MCVVLGIVCVCGEYLRGVFVLWVLVCVWLVLGSGWLVLLCLGVSVDSVESVCFVWCVWFWCVVGG